MADKDALVITLNGMVPLVAVSDSSDSKSKLRDSIFPNMSMRHEFGAVYDGVNAEDRAGKKESMNESASDGTATTTYGALHTALAVEVPKIASSEQDEEQQNDIGYRDLLTGNREFRLFISSYLVTNCGEWLTYIASIDLIETKLQKSSQESRTAISILVLVRLLPNVIFSAFGGILADRLDKRRLMVVLDVASAISGLFFVLAYELQSIVLVYMATLLQQILSGLYVPSSASIVPMLVRDDKELKKATTLEGLVWSGMQAFGAAASGFIVNALGIRTCFCM
jgi:Na+/melibiose symporter-like transporter